MLIYIDMESEIPIYLQLRNQIVMGVANQALRYGTALPSTRRLAQDLGINMHTVAKAYNLLKSEGFICAHKRKGFVVRGKKEMAEKVNLKNLWQNLEIAAAEAHCSGMDGQAFLGLCQEAWESFGKGKTG